MSASRDLLADVLSRGTGISQTDAYGDLDALARPEHLSTLVRWLVGTAGTDPLVAALADAVTPGNLVAAMVEQGVLVVNTVHLRDGTPKTYRAAEPGEETRG